MPLLMPRKGHEWRSRGDQPISGYWLQGEAGNVIRSYQREKTFGSRTNLQIHHEDRKNGTTNKAYEFVH